MSKVIKGLAGIRSHQEAEQARKEAASRPKAEWLGSVFPKTLGNIVEVSFVQEMDEGATNYNPARGVGCILVEHEPPGKQGFMRRSLCTGDEGSECYGCERRKADFKEGWKTKQNLYINVAVKVDEEVKVFVLQRNANSAFAQQLIQEAIDDGTITDTMFRITKSGEGTDTIWLLKRLKTKPYVVEDDALFDIDTTVVRNIPYDEQPEYFAAVYSGPAPAGADADEPAAAADEQW